MSEIFLDTETTGLSYKDGHKIVEVACIETKDFLPTKKIFHQIINPERNVPNEAFEIHGFSTEFLKSKPVFGEIVDEFINFVGDKKIIIHNASFDIGFINHELKILKKNEIKKENVIDSLELAREKFPGTSNSLDSLCKRFNIDLTKRTKHNALLDCELLREVYINLLDAREPKLMFSKVEEAYKSSQFDNEKKYSKKVVKLTENEIMKHKNYLKKEFKKNYY